MSASRRLWSSVIVLCMLAAGAGRAAADPPGSRWMNPGPSNVPVVRVLGASSAGVLYELTNRGFTISTVWFKPAGGMAYRLNPPATTLVGTTLFTRLWDHNAISYRNPPTGVEHRCTVPDADYVAYILGGWIQQPRFTGDFLVVTAGPNGCTSRRLTTIADSRLVAADETGFAVEVTTFLGDGGVHDLRYVPYLDPDHSVLADTGSYVYNYVSMSGGAIAWARQHANWEPPGSTIQRWSRTGGSDPAVTVDYVVDSTAVTTGAVAFAGCPTLFGAPPTCAAGSIPAGGGPVSIVTGASHVADDDSSLYLARFGPGTGIDRGSSFADPAALTRVVAVPLVPPGTYAVALGASRAAYVDSDGAGGPLAGGQSLHWRYAAKSGGGISLLAPIRGGEDVAGISIDGRRQLIGRTGDPGSGSLVLRTEGGEPDVTVFRDVPGQAVYVGGRIELSGTRALWLRQDYTGDPCEPPGCPQYGKRSAILYDVRTRTSIRLGEADTTRWALWGSYVVWATKDGSIYRRELSSNKVVTVKSKGYGVVGLGVWGSYVGWSECVDACYKGNVAYRNLATGAAPVRVPTPVVALAVRVTGGHVVYAIGDQPGQGAPHLRELRLGTKVTAPIADAWWNPEAPAFDAHDEVLAWITPDEKRAMVAPNSAYADPPKYLGNALGSATFTPNGDGVGDAWTPEFPVSKALPTCQVVIRSKVTGTVLRRLACGSSTGSARVAWDGRIASGRLVPKGSYGWTLTGSDADGALRWWTGSTIPIAGSVVVA